MMNKHQSLCVLGIALALFLYAPSAGASAASTVSISLISNSPTVTPGNTISFAAGSSGFTNPQYSFSDSYSGTGGTSGTIDKVGGFFSWKPTVYDAGTHIITVTATDDFGDTASNSITLYVESNAVFLNNLAPGTIVAYGRPITFSFVTPGYVNPHYLVYDSFGNSNVSPAAVNTSGNFSWTPSISQQGQHTLRIDITDAYGHSNSIQQDILITSPQVSIALLPHAGTTGTPLTFATLATGLASTTTFSLADTFSGTSTISASNIDGSGKFSWMPATSDIGTHAISIIATDGFGNSASTTAQIFITAGAAAASATSSSTTTSSVITSSATPLPSATVSSASPAATVAPQSATTAVTSSTYKFSTALVLGSRGTAVTQLQKRLVSLDYLSATPTGYYGPLTAAAVKKFQAANSISPTGFVGPLTRAALNR